MASQLTCPHCQSSLKTNKSLPGGMEVKCPKCKAAFKVPAEGMKPAKVAAAVGGARTAPPGGSGGPDSSAGQFAGGRSGKTERSAKQANDNVGDASPSKMPMAAVIGGGVIILAVAVGVGVWAYSGTPPPEDKKNPEAKVVANDKDDRKEPAALNINIPATSPGANNVEGPPPKVVAKGLVNLNEEETQLLIKIKDKGIGFLKRTQNAGGEWIGNSHGPNLLGIAGLTLLQYGVSPDDPKMKELAKKIRAEAGTNDLYALCAHLIFLDKLGDPKDEPLIKSMALRLIVNQTSRGAWGYAIQRRLTPAQEDELTALLNDLGKTDWKEFAAANPDRIKKLSPVFKELALAQARDDQANFYLNEGGDNPPGDNSHAQFGLLALSAARRHKIPVDQSLNLIVKRFRGSQQPDGSWGYPSGAGVDHGGKSMTCAGLMALSVGYVLDFPKPFKSPAEDPLVQKAIRVVGTVIKDGDTKADVYIYSLWSIERVGVLLNTDNIDGKDWFRWGMKILHDRQKDDGSWNFGPQYHGFGTLADTCFALLFLQQANLFSEEIAEEIKRLDFGAPAARPMGTKE
jgi:predicted Zn finger-like uncharacterized protein